jgi:hypothetical protein
MTAGPFSFDIALMRSNRPNILIRMMLLAIMLVALVPFGSPRWNLNNLGDLNVDLAFQLALPYFLEQHLQFGDQIVFTYGPWGILRSAFSGSIFHTLFLLFRVALATSVFLAFCILSNRCSSRVVAWGGAVGLVLLWVTGQRDSYFLFPAVLVAYQHLAASIASDESKVLPARRWELLFWIALSMLSGWVSLTKFTVFIVASAAYLLVLVEDIRRRRWPVLPFAYVVALMMAWLGAGQNPAYLQLWVLRCLDLSNGYVDAMSKGFFIPYDAMLVAIYYGAVVLIALVAFSAAAWHRWRSAAMLSLLFTLFLCATSVKHGLGGNQIEQSLALLATVLWFVIQLFFLRSEQDVRSGFRGWRVLATSSALAASLCLTVVAARTNFPIDNLWQAVVDMRTNASLLTHASRDIFTDHWDAALEDAHRLWQPATMPKGQTIDVYPQQTGVVIGREGLRYSPRPAFLSLNAHTSALAMLNARHLEEKNTAPDLILFQVLPRERAVNNRHPALADGPSWPLLLSHYVSENADDEFLLLKRRSSPLRMTRQLLVDANLQLDESVILPQDRGNLIWAELEVKRSPLGDIVHALYKSPHVLLKSRTADNVTHAFQIVPELGQAGFLISPLVQNNAAFIELYRDRQERADTIRSITVSSPEAPDFFWKRTFRLRLWSLNIDYES